MTMVESRETLQHELREVEKWEQDQKDLWFWEKIGRLPFVLLDKITPAFIHEKINVILDEIGQFIQSGGRYLVSSRSVYEALQRRLPAVEGSSPQLSNNVIESAQEAARIPLEVMDLTAIELEQSRARVATVQGATTGFGGVFTLAIDIPVLLGLSLKVLQEMALCYGYDPNDRQERIFIVKCLQFVSSDIVGKRAVLDELVNFSQNGRSERGISQLQGWREVIAAYRDNFGWKKLFQLVPVAGMVFGAYINRGTVKDVAEAGRMLYRKRRILERLQAANGNSTGAGAGAGEDASKIDEKGMHESQ
ncbi:EcsC family protein [Paenibacillus turpanensis]|uniref:EcsC family protein n=1 Tax=Paenibacillus turpanensis TaxID=2689078 RepID=UPI00140E80A6|nr:EcsC family protein [Paenibacillus turpanensis]